MDYAVYEDLRTALTTNQPETLVIEELPPPMTAPYRDSWSNWTATDIAAVPTGGQRAFSASKVDVYGGGRDIWGDRDGFRFLWQSRTGDVEIVATVTNLLEPGVYAKAGLMIRKSLDSDAPFVLLHLFANGQVVTSWRTNAGATVAESPSLVKWFPIWLKMKKTGNTASMWYSMDGQNWIAVGSSTFSWLGDDCLAGLAVDSNDERFLNCASFENITISGGP